MADFRPESQKDFDELIKDAIALPCKAPSERTVSIHVYYSKGGVQEWSFVGALGEYKKDMEYIGVNIEVTKFDTEHVRKLHWSPLDLINWLMDADAHIITTHIHQGHDKWHGSDATEALGILMSHPGFPSGDALMCPVFRQDKRAYLDVLPDDMKIPTICKSFNIFSVKQYLHPIPRAVVDLPFEDRGRVRQNIETFMNANMQ
jgi:hypothetical protein